MLFEESIKGKIDSIKHLVIAAKVTILTNIASNEINLRFWHYVF